MRIIVTSDLHYNVARSQAPTRAIAKEICGVGGDFLVFVGDSAAMDLTVLDEVFGLFESFKGARLATAGNHELWIPDTSRVQEGVDSLSRYEKELAEVCSRNGVHYLDGGPFEMDGVAVVGSVGWYDFTFRPPLLEIPLRFYEHKVAPGAAVHMKKHRHLFDGEEDLPPAARQVTTQWMDGEHVRLPVSDADFTRMLADKLRRHLGQVHDTADHVVACLHHLPFAELVPHSVIPNWEFATGFMGSELFGETLLAFPKVRHVYCGHSHRSQRCQKGPLVCTSVGSTYREKRYEVLDLERV